MKEIFRNARWIIFSLLILSIIFIAADCQKKPPPRAKKTKTGPKAYEDIEVGRLNRMPKKGRRLRRMAYHLMHDGRYEAALSFLREELKRAKGAEKIGTMSDMADCFREIEENDSAINLYHKCQVLAESLNDSVDLSSACAEMGQVYCAKGEYKKARPLFEKSFELAIKTKDCWNIAASYLDFADLYLATKKYEEAKESALKALEISEEKGIEQFKIIALNQLEMIDNATQDYDSSKTILNEPQKVAPVKEKK
jgi:tetratricopeptide (TPR) repeat protein